MPNLSKLLLLLPFLFVTQAYSQPNSIPVNSEYKSPGGAFFRSAVIPGWGHHYADRTSWNRGKLHLGVEIALISAVFGYDAQHRHLRNNLHASARNGAGVNIQGRDKSFQLAVAHHVSLTEYNRFQEQTRNWDRFLPETPENQWDWGNDAERQKFNALRGRMESARRQVPMLIGLMVTNRLVSGVSAALKARNNNQHLPEIGLHPILHPDGTGYGASMLVRF